MVVESTMIFSGASSLVKSGSVDATYAPATICSYVKRTTKRVGGGTLIHAIEVIHNS